MIIINKSNDKITVAIPTYNGEKFIDDALYSIFKQTYFVDKIIISDDNSSDATLEIANKLNKTDSRISIYANEHNLGYQKNWNKCFEYCQTKYLVILHQDDCLQKHCIEHQLDFINKNPQLALVGGKSVSMDVNGTVKGNKKTIEDRTYNKGDIYEFIKEQGSYIPCSSVLFNMNKIRKVGFFDEDYLATDELYWPKVLIHYPIAILGMPLIYGRYHEGQAEWSDFKNKKREIIAWGAQFKKIANYEKRVDKRKKLLVIMNKKSAYACTGSIFRSALRDHRSSTLALFYLYNGLKAYPLIIIEMIFWKSIVKSIIIYLGYLEKNKFQIK